MGLIFSNCVRSVNLYVGMVYPLHSSQKKHLSNRVISFAFNWCQFAAFASYGTNRFIAVTTEPALTILLRIINLCEFSHQYKLVTFTRLLSDSKSPQFSRTLLNILGNPKSALVERGCRIHRMHFYKGVVRPTQMSVMDITLNNMLVRFH